MQTSPKRIYVDVDDVISRTTETYTGLIEQEFGKKVAFGDIESFDLKTSFGLTDNEFSHFFDLIHEPDFLMGFKAVEGAVRVLSLWADQGHCVDIVTGRPASSRDVSLEWLNFKGICFDEFIMVDKYSRPGNDLSIAISKEELASFSYDLAVEDSGDMALFLARDMGVRVALYDRPWNGWLESDGKLVRCRSWEEVQAAAL